jgi:hypothetical protein
MSLASFVKGSFPSDQEIERYEERRKAIAENACREIAI